MEKSENSLRSMQDLWVFFGLSLVISWVLLIPEIAGTAFQIPTPLLVLVGFGPALAALIVSAVADGRSGIRELLGKLEIVKVNGVWYGIAILGPPLLFLAALGLGAALGINVDLSPPPIRSQVKGEIANPWFLILPAYVYLLITLLGEELGWRGYALPRLLQTQSEFTASLILGFFWGIWHLPMAWAPSLQAGITHLPLGWFLLDILAMSFIYTWMFVNTRGSLLLALLLHASNNLGAMFLPILPPAAPGTGIFFIIMAMKWVGVIALLMRSGWADWKIHH